MIYHLEKAENTKIKKLVQLKNQESFEKKSGQMSIIACLRTRMDPLEVVLVRLIGVDLILILS